MDEELQKRNTDCVYFLASPLTCKKGIECEYRHSEIARLNPRDCWYWLAGSCLNPSCAFRHPPLDACTELSSESAPPQYQCSLPVNKVNVPCYFYFNGFCTKGDRCSFLHGPEDGKAALKSLKTASDAPPMENGPCAESDAGSTQIETHPNPAEAAKEAVEMEIKPTEGIHLSAIGIVKDQSASPHLSASDYEEAAAALRSDTLLLGKGLIQRRSLVSSDQSSEDQLDGHIEREDWLESSPGFDVLVDDRSEALGYEDDPECLLTIDRDGKELNGHFLGYDYSGHVDYDSAYPDTGMLYEQKRLDSYDQFDNEEGYDYMREVSGRSRNKMSDPILPRKRKFFPVDLAIDGWRGVDLRSHLRKRRVIDGRQVTRFSRRNNSQIDGSQERSQRHGRSRLCGRLTTEVNDNGLGSLGKNGSLLNGADPQGWFRHSRSDRYRPRQRYKEKRQHKQQFHPSEVSRKPIARKRPEEAGTFIGPKTLAQIKEEKRKATGNGDSSGMLGHPSRTISEEFQGPKPLSEILKDKKKLGGVKDGNSDSS